MKTLTHTNIQVQGNIVGEKVAMTFDENSLAHIMSVLTDLYSDPEMAIIREYSTNAYDAHIEAGQTKPIEIILPTPLNFNLTIKDHGVGLSLEDIHRIYSKYGASTKRESNDQVGMLGLGCKSALTYTSQFTLTSVKDGKKVQAIVSRDEDGAGSIKIVSNTETTEEAGTSISIPAKKGNALELKARKFFAFWEPGTVLVNGQAPATFRTDSKTFKLSEKIFAVDGSWFPGNDNCIVVMGNVPYPCNISGVSSHLQYSFKGVFYVDIGEVAFTPSRESLYMSSITKKTLARLETEFESSLRKRLQEDVDKAASCFEAWKVSRQFEKMFRVGQNSFLYKGENIPTNIPSNKDDGFLLVDAGHYGSLSKTSTAFHLSTYFGYAQSERKVVWVENFSIKKFTTTHKRKLEKLLLSQGSNFDLAVVTTKPYSNKWLPNNRVIIDFEDVRNTKLDSDVIKINDKKDNPDYNSIGSTEPGLGYTASVELLQKLDLTKVTIYYSTSDDRHSSYKFRQYLDTLKERFVLLEVPSNRQNKFLRLFPQAKTVSDAIKEIADKWKNSLTSEDKKTLAYHLKYARSRGMVRSIDLHKVDDPAIKEVVKYISKDFDDQLRQFDQMSKLIHIMLPSIPDAFQKYTMLSLHHFTQCPDHAYMYVNAVYNSMKSKV